jgi:acyl dehydratase
MSSLWSSTAGEGATRCERLVTALSRSDIARYAGASGDVNLLHVDEPFARAAGHRAVLAHGMLTMGLTGSFLTRLVGHGRVRRFGGRFLAPVFAGDSLDCTVRVSSVRRTAAEVELELGLHTTKDDGTVVFMGEALAVRTVEETS